MNIYITQRPSAHGLLAKSYLALDGHYDRLFLLSFSYSVTSLAFQIPVSHSAAYALKSLEMKSLWARLLFSVLDVELDGHDRPGSSIRNCCNLCLAAMDGSMAHSSGSLLMYQRVLKERPCRRVLAIRDTRGSSITVSTAFCSRNAISADDDGASRGSQSTNYPQPLSGHGAQFGILFAWCAINTILFVPNYHLLKWQDAETEKEMKDEG